MNKNTKNHKETIDSGPQTLNPKALIPVQVPTESRTSQEASKAASSKM